MTPHTQQLLDEVERELRKAASADDIECTQILEEVLGRCEAACSATRKAIWQARRNFHEDAARRFVEAIRQMRGEAGPAAGDLDAAPVHCQCGEITGERCSWTGPRSSTVVVEHMPEAHRASHDAARNRGMYPHNGAVRLRLERTCAESLCDDDWTAVAGGEGGDHGA